jgi:hypothetical protein
VNVPVNPGVSAGSAAIFCPNADQVLARPPPPGGGGTTINFQVGLADGTILNQTVVWNLIM